MPEGNLSYACNIVFETHNLLILIYVVICSDVALNHHEITDVIQHIHQMDLMFERIQC